MSSASAQYMQTVDKARSLVRTMEAATQALYDDGMVLFMTVQSLSRPELLSDKEFNSLVGVVERTAPTVRSNCVLVAQTLESLLATGHDQAAIGQGDYRNSIEWRTSRINMTDASIAGLTSHLADVPSGDDEFVDMELAFSRPGMRTLPSSADTVGAASISSTIYNNAGQPSSQSSLDMSDRSRSDSLSEPQTPTWSQTDTTVDGTFVGGGSGIDMGPNEPLDDDVAPYVDEEERMCHVYFVSQRVFAHLLFFSSCYPWQVPAARRCRQQAHEAPRSGNSARLHQPDECRPEAVVPTVELRPGRDSHRSGWKRARGYWFCACRTVDGARAWTCVLFTCPSV